MTRPGAHLLAAWCLLVAGCSAALSLRAEPPAYPSFYPADSTRGQTLAASCVACHGSAQLTFGKESYHAPKLGRQRPSSIFDALLEYKQGKRRSDVMKGAAAALSEQDMRDVAAYLAEGIVQPNFDPLPQSWARTKVLDDCAACHGETGLGVMHGIPVIGGQYRDYLVHALRAYKNGERSDPTMMLMARKLSDQQIADLAVFFDSLADRNYLRASP